MIPVQPETFVAWIGLGSNLGDRRENLEGALRALDTRDDVCVAAASRLRETAPVGGPPQGRFLNGTAELVTRLSPYQLLSALHEVEADFDRTRDVRWGPRTLDLDLLLYEGRVIDTPELKVPHPRMHERRFVLGPLCELCPMRLHPVLGKPLRRLLAELRT